MKNKIIKVQAIKKVMKKFNGIATWGMIYNNIEKYYPDIKKSKEWEAGIRGVLYREIKKSKNFKKIEEGIFSLKDYEESNSYIKKLKYKKTDKEIISKIRIG